MEGTRGTGTAKVAEFKEARVDKYSDGGRAEGPSPGTEATVVATSVEGLYLAQYTTVIDAEEAGDMLARQ